MTICAAPPKIVPQIPDRLPESKAANQKITGMTGLMSKFAAGTNTFNAIACNDSGIAEAVEFKNVTTSTPIIAPAIAIFFGLCSVSSGRFPFLINTAAAQFGIIRWSTSCVNAPAPTEDAHALKKNPKPNEKWDAASPAQAFNSPNVRNAPIPCDLGA